MVQDVEGTLSDFTNSEMREVIEKRSKGNILTSADYALC